MNSDTSIPQMPLHVISLGAGVQSSTMALMYATGELSPMPTCAIFADTQDEPREVYEWLAWLERQLPFPTLRVTAGRLSDSALAILNNRKTGKPYYSNRIPAFVKSAGQLGAGKVSRHCTRDFKIYPIQRQVRSLIPKPTMLSWRRKHRDSLKAITAHLKEMALARKEKRTCRSVFPIKAWRSVQSDALVIQLIGMSKDEATRCKPSRVPWVRHEYPLINQASMRRWDCLRWWEGRYESKAAPFKEPPRSACIFCPYKSNAEWRRLKDTQPEEFAKAAQFERDLQKTHSGIVTSGKLKGIPFLHRSLVPLTEVDLSTEAERGQASLFENECEGMCGV